MNLFINIFKIITYISLSPILEMSFIIIVKNRIM
jgi:hypothetical protein